MLYGENSEAGAERCWTVWKSEVGEDNRVYPAWSEAESHKFRVGTVAWSVGGCFGGGTWLLDSVEGTCLHSCRSLRLHTEIEEIKREKKLSI